jgi:5'-nucleotidase
VKLLVPRPPAGAGPDIDPVVPIAWRQEVVEPPAFVVPPERTAAEPQRDAFVSRTALEESLPPALPDQDMAPPQQQLPQQQPPPQPQLDPPAAAAAPRLEGMHVVERGDSWWSLAERAYGDGRLYRPLFAWNRSLDPTVSLAPGTRLEIPPLARLAAAWPRLMPRD